MKGVVYTKPGTVDGLKIMEVKSPTPSNTQVLIKVKASSINISDYGRFTGANGKTPMFYKMQDKMTKAVGNVLGGDIAGVVVKTGENVTKFHKGDEVFGFSLGAFPVGGWAEYALAEEDNICIKPQNLSFEEAAAIPVTGITALGAVQTANVSSGKQVLVYGASGGVGQFAVQISKALGGVVTGVCSTRNIEIVKRMGADFTIDYKCEDFTKSNRTYDAILGINGYNPLKAYKQLLRKNGVYVAVGGTRQGMMGMFGSLYSNKEKTLTSSAFASVNKPDSLLYLKNLAETGQLKPYIDNIYSIKEVKNAITYVVKEHTHGKVVFTMDF